MPVGINDMEMTRCACDDARAGATHTRRAMLGGATLGVLGLAAACGQERAEKSGGDAAQTVTIAKADVPAVNAEPFKASDGTFYLVQNQDGLLALSRTCTHMGCKVPWNQGEQCFHCPCHNSKFDRNGVRTAGPAKRPLDLIKLAVQANGDVTASPDDQTERKDYQPDQAAPYPAKSA